MIVYFFESTLFLGVSLGLYFALFRQSKHWVFNRFYLLAVIALSFGVPCIDFEVATVEYFDTEHLIDRATAGTPGWRPWDRVTATENSTADSNDAGWLILIGLYSMGVLLMAVRFIKNLWSLRRLLVRSSVVCEHGHHTVLLDHPIEPFAFLKWIFVSRSAFERKEIPAAVWAHESSHVRRLHTLDILFVEMLLVVFYMQPLLWICRNAIRLNHEHQADQDAVRTHPDLRAYAYQLIRRVQPLHHTLFDSSFNFLSTKQRLIMLHKKKNRRSIFIAKSFVGLALLTVTVALLAFQTTPDPNALISSEGRPVIVIDIGHGGDDRGAVGVDGKTTEVDILNGIGSKLRALDDKGRYMFTRGDGNMSLKERTQLAREKNANLFVSLHVGSSENPQANGIEVFYSPKNPQATRSRELGESFVNRLQFRSGSRDSELKTANFVVLKDISCPSVLVTLGFLSNSEDFNYLQREKNQADLAKQIFALLEQTH